MSNKTTSTRTLMTFFKNIIHVSKDGYFNENQMSEFSFENEN